MVSSIFTATLLGYQSQLVKTEVDILPGLMGVQIVGLGDNSVKEAKTRVRSAILNSGFEFPVKSVIVNLAPNEIPKEGGLTELSIALGILIATEQLPEGFFADKLILGGLSLDGSLQKPKGLLASVILAREVPFINAVLLPQDGLDEAACVPDIELIPLRHLRELTSPDLAQKGIRGKEKFVSGYTKTAIDVTQIKNQERAKRGIMIALSGGHHSMLVGAPGSGKTMLARSMESLQYPLSLQESLEITRIHAAAGKEHQGLLRQRPFRSPHHTSSSIALVGGGSRPLPGEVSLAHKGILFLDELFEFSSSALQSLREPLQDKRITVSRARGSFTFPADCILVAATNPCKCGYLFSKHKRCSCKPHQVQTLYRKVLGPFLDRIALEIETQENAHLWPQPVTVQEGSTLGKDLHWWRSYLHEARLRMLYRNQNQDNARLATQEVLVYLEKFPSAFALLKELTAAMQLTHRGMLNSARVAFTIMDLDAKDKLLQEHVEEAFSFRVFNYYRQKLHAFIA